MEFENNLLLFGEHVLGVFKVEQQWRLTAEDQHRHTDNPPALRIESHDPQHVFRGSEAIVVGIAPGGGHVNDFAVIGDHFALADRVSCPRADGRCHGHTQFLTLRSGHAGQHGAGCLVVSPLHRLEELLDGRLGWLACCRLGRSRWGLRAADHEAGHHRQLKADRDEPVLWSDRAHAS